MNPLFALLIAVQAFLTEAAPEIRERCTETTYQKLQGLLVQIEGATDERAQYENYLASLPPTTRGMPDEMVSELFPGGPDLADLIPRVMAVFEKQEAMADQREEIQAKQLAVLERLTTLLFDTGTPAA